MVTVRNYIPGEAVRWTEEEIGTRMVFLEPEWTWVVFVDGRMEGMLVASHTRAYNAILLMRLLGGDRSAFWIRPLWKAVRAACVARNIVGFWTAMDNGREAERKLNRLLEEGRGGTAATLRREAPGVWISGRF